MFWLHARTYCRNLVILFFFEICKIGVIFSQKSFVCLKITIFRFKKLKIIHPKKNTDIIGGIV
jgi:hypothetical protein